MINKKTKLFVSVSRFPGSTGSLLHNTGYKMKNLNCTYFPLKCENISEFKSILNNKNFKGISVSMPFKNKALKFLNRADGTVKKTLSVNTIIRKKNILIGYNTDYLALKKIMKLRNIKAKNSLILGNGSTARTAYELLKELKIKQLYLCSRNKKNYKKWKIRKFDKIIDWNEKNIVKTDLFINCTPLGMENKNILPKKILKKHDHRCIIDLTINSKNKLSIIAGKLGINYVSGLEISLHQGVEQFKIYTNQMLIFKKIKKKLNYNF